MIFHLAELEEVVETVHFTASIRETVPVSLLLVGPSGTAKSLLLKQYESESFYCTDSFTSQGLWDMAQRDQQNLVRFMIVPDINPTLSRKAATVQSTISNLLSLTFDGTVRVSDGRVEKVCKHEPVGFLSAVTPEIYRSHARRWLWLGLRRRIIPLFFQYSHGTVSQLQDLTTNGKIHSINLQHKKIVLPAQRVSPGIGEREALLIRTESEIFTRFLGKLAFRDLKKQWKWTVTEMVPISPHLTLRALAQAHARKEKRAAVAMADIEFLRRFISYTDPETPRTI